MCFFKLMETKKSEVNNRNLPFEKYTIYWPDFFITFFFTSLIVFSCVLDLTIVVLLLLSKTHLALKILFIITAYLRIIFELSVEKETYTIWTQNKKRILQLLYNTMWKLLGLHSIIISSKILMNTLNTLRSSERFLGCSKYPIFYISNENLSYIKICCYIYLVTKSIPQLFIMSVFFGHNKNPGILVYFSTANIVFNITFFAFTMSITLPIRRKPRIFINFYCLLFSAINKFLATFCGCCVNLTVFMVMFNSVKYYAFLAHFLKIIIWVFPSHTLLSTQPIQLSSLQFTIYLIFFPVIYSFIFIHPFEKTWKLYYYFFYLVNGLMDLAFLGLWTDTELVHLSYWCVLRVIQIGFLSCYGLLNSLTKGHDCNLTVNITSNENIEKITTPKIKNIHNEASSSKQ